MTIKRLKDWRILLALGVIFSFGLLLMTMINDFYELPSDGFSKEVFLRHYEKNDLYEAYDEKCFASGAYAEGFYLLLNDRDKLIFETYSPEGTLHSSRVIGEGIPSIADISTELEENQLHYIYWADQGLYAGSIDTEAGVSLGQELVDSGVDSVVLHGSTVAYRKSSAYFYYSENAVPLFDDDTILQFDYTVYQDTLLITTVSRDGGSFYSTYYRMNLSDGDISKNQVAPFITTNATKDAGNYLIVADDTVRSMSIFRDTRTSSTYYKELVYDWNRPESYTLNKFEMQDFPNFRYKAFQGDKVVMMMEQFTFVAKDELASADSTYRNLVEVTDESGTRSYRQLTKMKKSHPIYEFFKYHDEDYLVFNTISKEGGSSVGSIYFASSDADVVKTSNVLTKDAFMQLFFGALTVLPAAFAVGFIPSMGFLFPVILMIMPLSMYKITWTEHHPEKLLGASMIVYLVSVLFGFYENATMILAKTQVMAGSLPWHLKSVSSMYMMLILTLSVSFLAQRWYREKKPQASFMIHFGIMFICQSIFYIMLFHAYPLLAN